MPLSQLLAGGPLAPSQLPERRPRSVLEGHLATPPSRLPAGAPPSAPSQAPTPPSQLLAGRSLAPASRLRASQLPAGEAPSAPSGLPTAGLLDAHLSALESQAPVSVLAFRAPLPLLLLLLLLLPQELRTYAPGSPSQSSLGCGGGGA